jgi:type IV pilus assembly protein PilW
MNQTTNKPHSRVSLCRQSGLSMIELMVSITIGLIIMAAVLGLYSHIYSNNAELAKANSQIENGRYAIQLMENDIIHAGYWGEFVPQFDNLSFTTAPTDVPAAVPDPCLAYNTTNWNTAYVNELIGIPIQSYDTASVCTGVVTNMQANSDMLVVRHAATCVPNGYGTSTDANCPAQAAGKLYFQASLCSGDPQAFVLNTSGFTLHMGNCATAADIRQFISDIYYIRNYSVTPGDGIPTLVMSSFGQSGGTPVQQSAQALVPGIDAIRVVLGVDDKSKSGAAINSAVLALPVSWNGTTATNRGDGNPDRFIRCTTGSPCTADELENVVVVQLYVLARAQQPTTGYKDTKTYDLGGTTLGPFNDRYKRHVYSTSIRLNDVSGRRDTP